MYRPLILCLLLLGNAALHAQTKLGQWSEHLPWLPARSVTISNDKVFCASSSGLFSVTTGEEQDITRFSKVNGLHDIGISTIGSTNGSVLVAYQNSNLDLLQGNNIYNIPDILRKQVSGDKTIYRIFFSNNNAYLCTGLGIIVVDLAKTEIADTWVTGSSYTPVYALEIMDGYFYAATAAGLKKAPVTGTNLADYRNWTTSQFSDTIQQVVKLGTKLICRQKNQLHQLIIVSWQPWYNSFNNITNLSVNNNQLLICEKGITILNVDATKTASLTFPAPLAAVANNQEIWVADSLQGLVRYSNNEYVTISPNAPASIITGDMIFVNNVLWAAAGGITNNWTATGNTNGYYTYEKGEWKQFKGSKDLVTLAAAPEGVYMGSFGNGLTLNNTKTYNNVSKITGLATDIYGNLWVSDYGASYNLLRKTPDDKWSAFRPPIAQSFNAVSQIVTDDNGQVWIVSPQGNGLFVYKPDTDQWRQFRVGAQQGNLPSNDVYSIAKDKNGAIWVGTARGIGVINCTDCDAFLPIIKQDNFAGYLFQDEKVNTIAVDGANRKWVGTMNGAWLVSEDGEKILEQFNTTNSPLPANRIYKIAIDPVNGEVYFATEKGLMSWHGMATEGVTMKKDEVLVFPNPVPPSYGGPIAIRGLSRNALVKITDISGRMVFQTRSQGGQAVWSGSDYTGHRPQSGVYLVFATSETGEEHLVTKIVFIN